MSDVSDLLKDSRYIVENNGRGHVVYFCGKEVVTSNTKFEAYTYAIAHRKGNMPVANTTEFHQTQTLWSGVLERTAGELKQATTTRQMRRVLSKMVKELENLNALGE